MAVFTPLGKDHLLLNRFECTEGISQLFSIEAELLFLEETNGYKPTKVEPQSLIGQSVAFHVKSEDGAERQFCGIVNRISQGIRDTRFSYYTVSVVPHVWILTQIRQSRIFQHLNVRDIVFDKIFAGFEKAWEVQGEKPARDYCVQYRESDFDFASRLLEEEGIYYFFRHEDGRDKIVFANTSPSHPNCPSKHAIPYSVDVEDYEGFIGAIHSIQTEHLMQTGKVTRWDYHFQLPTNHLEKTASGRSTFQDVPKLESYDYPAGYAKKYDGINSGGGEDAGTLNQVFNDREATVKSTMEAMDARIETSIGRADCCSLTAGHTIEMSGHPVAETNGKYVLTSVRHTASQSPAYVSNEVVPEPYVNEFTCIRYGAGSPVFKPLQKTPKPFVRGSQTGFVVGPAGEEIFTDKYGRVKVQFHWDRDNKADASSSCWIRVAQTWAGNKWGAMFIPRIGMEVVVSFLEGDPDQPIITGCVYNPQTMPPYTLPDEKTKSTLKSNSSKGGGGFNEFRFEDKKGSEQIFVHAEKDVDLRVKNDVKEKIIRDRHVIIDRDQFEKVGKDKHLSVVGDQNEKIDGSISIKAGQDIQEKAGTKFAVDAGTEIHLKSGTSLTLETGTNLTLKVGGNFININPGGIFIKGTMVMLNSGGAAGTGSGSNPTPPKAPLEADRADPGTATQAPRAASPPQRPTFMSEAAQVLVNAAVNGTAFCEICSRA